MLSFNIFGNILVTLDIRFRAIRCVRKAGLSPVRSDHVRHTRGQPGSVRVTSVAELLVGERFHDVVNKRRYYFLEPLLPFLVENDAETFLEGEVLHLSLRYCATALFTAKCHNCFYRRIGCGTIPVDFPPAVLS